MGGLSIEFGFGTVKARAWELWRQQPGNARLQQTVGFHQSGLGGEGHWEYGVIGVVDMQDGYKGIDRDV